MLEELKARVCRENLRLKESGLVVLTWGNVSAVDRESGLVVIKPSGVPYESLTPEDMVVVDADGRVAEGRYRPSSDTPTHLYLYKTFPALGGIVHTHSGAATAFAQARRPIIPLGTTHADAFFGEVPLTRPLTAAEIETAYEENTGKAIAETFLSAGIDPLSLPAVLCVSHGPFTFGPTPEKAVENAVTLEAVARMAIDTLALAPDTPAVPGYLLRKHYNRKHGKNAYYGQG